MLHRGAKPAAVYRGAYKPGKLYRGAQLVAGYEDVTKAAPASWDGTYDDVMGVVATGKGKQDGTPTPSTPVPLVASEGSLTASGRTGTTPTTVTLPALRAIPGSDIRDTLAYIGNGQWQLTRRVGVTVVDGETVKFTGGAEWWNLPAGSSPGVGEALVTTTSMGVTLYGNSSAGFLFTQQAWAAGVKSADALNALCQVAPMTTWYELVTPTTETVTLGELPSYPVHTELAVSGDYPPDVTGTVKVGI